MPHLLPLLLLIFLGCGVGYTDIAGEVRPITPTPPSISVSPSSAALQQFIRSAVVGAKAEGAGHAHTGQRVALRETGIEREPGHRPIL